MIIKLPASLRRCKGCFAWMDAAKVDSKLFLCNGCIEQRGLTWVRRELRETILEDIKIAKRHRRKERLNRIIAHALPEIFF